MKVPTEIELERLIHRAAYDPQKAHDYYERHKHLKGRKKGSDVPTTGAVGRRNVSRHSGRRAQQKKELAAVIQTLEGKLRKLEDLIRKKEHAAASENRKGKAKKERAAKEKNKPKSAAEKAKAARENEKYRKKHKQSLKTKAKTSGKSGSGGGSSKGKTDVSKASVTELKSLATKVKGQIAIAKKKLAAL
jgi:hypothetical protein